MTTRNLIIDRARALINGPRQAEYGPPAESFNRAAVIWSGILGMPIGAYQVALCMAGLKIARLAHIPQADSFADGIGYLALAAELVGVDLPEEGDA